MEDPTKYELEALRDAGTSCGVYLEGIRKTDLATLTPEEFDEFIDTVCTGFIDSMRRQTGMTLKR
jgi:hypothetical protein